MSAATIGPARSRVDGRLKVTGAAKYAVEFEIPKCAYGWTVESNIAKGKITAIDTKAAQAVPGVLAVLTHLNMPKFTEPPKKEERGTSSGISRSPFAPWTRTTASSAASATFMSLGLVAMHCSLWPRMAWMRL